jgi:copper chaperone NosL
MRRSLVIAVCATALLVASACSRSAPKPPSGPLAAQQGLDSEGHPRIAPTDRCPICGMYPAKNPRFAGAIELTDGRAFYSCGPGCLLKMHLHPEVYLKVDRPAIRRAIVQEYLGGKPIDAASATWVQGSDVIGPMGPALVPLANAADVATFRERHGGKNTFQLSELDDARFEALTGRKVVPPQK